MGVIDALLRLLFGDGRNVVKDTAEVFFENRENAGIREATLRTAALDQFGREFAQSERGSFDRFMDGLNRIPRPLMAFGTIGLCITAMIDPVWFAARMQGIALVPEPLWWLLGAIVSFYFGARYQFKSQEFQRSVATTMANVPQVTANIARLQSYGQTTRLRPRSPRLPAATQRDGNKALDAWKETQDE